MTEYWNNAIITDIVFVIYVAPHTSIKIHHNRPFHGFVINDTTSEKRIHFSDGTVLHSGPNEVHYLPKGSSYRVEEIVSGGCWAINFDVLEQISDKPFNIRFRNHESVLKNFKDSAAAWIEKTDCHNAIIRKNIYDIILKIKKEEHRNYMPDKKEMIIAPALDAINRNYTKNDLSVKDMATLCNISEAYFRRIFFDKFSLTPKEYIIKLRMDYAKHLLESGQFPVTEIAQMCGYFEPCHFSREFKKHFGTSPKEYKKASRV